MKRAENMFDLVIENGICFISGNFVESNIGITNNKIAYVGRESIKGREKINARGCLVLPGFFNAHTHSAMTILRGYAEGLPLDKWLDKVWKIEAMLDERSIYIASMLACIEMLKNGITCFSDMYIHMDSVARAVEETGIRAVLGYGMADRGSEERMEKELKIALDFIKNCENKERIKPMLTPHAIYTCSPEFLSRINDLANEMGLIKHIHASETLWEVKESKKKFGKTPIKLLDDIKFLDQRTVLAHCVWLSGDEINLIANRRTSVAHCPSSNLKLSSGIAKIAEMTENGVNVAIGTDGAASNNMLNIFSEIRLSALLQQLRKKFLNPVKYLEMATKNGYRAYGIDGGEIEKGKIADIIVVEPKIHQMPIYNYANSLVFSSTGCEVRDVIVNGKIVVEDRTPINVDDEKVVDQISKLKEKILGKA